MRLPQDLHDLRGAALVGVVAGLLTAVCSFVALFLIGLLPSQVIGGLFGSGGHEPLLARLSDAALSPWNGGTYASWKEVPEAGLSVSRWAVASWGGVVVLFAVLSLVGVLVRRSLPDSLRERAVTLVSAGLTVAIVTALCAALLRYNTPAKGPPGGGSGYYTSAAHHYHGAASYFASALVLTLLLGAFAFDVVGLLREPIASAMRRAGALVGIAFLGVGLLFPAFVVSDRLPTARVTEDFGRASAYSSAVGSFAIPLALQAPVSVSNMYITPWINHHATSDQTSAHWQNLAIATALDHPRGRLFQYAASLGIWGSLVGVAITAALLAALTLVTIGLCRRFDAATPREGLRLGVLEGACLGFLITVATVVTTFSYRVHFGGIPAGPGWSPPMDLWRTTPLGLAYSAAVLIGFYAATGYAYTRFRRRRRHGRRRWLPRRPVEATGQYGESDDVKVNRRWKGSESGRSRSG